MLLLYGGAAFYLGMQFDRRPEERHWHRLRKRLSRRKTEDVPEFPHEPDIDGN